MATVSKWTPFGVALDITAVGGTVTRKSATQYTVSITASWETYYSGAQTNYGMTAASGGVTSTISAFNGTKRSSGSSTFTGTYSISGNGSATKSVTVTFRNFNTDNGDSATKTVSFNVTVPAWTSYKITYNANGGSGAPSAQTKWKDQTLTLSSTKPTRTGYSFLGWSTSSSATSATYSAGGSYTSNSAATLYAVWKANTYTVSYNANGGSGAPTNQTKTYDKTLTLSSTKPTRANYTFKGWGTSASATTVAYAAGANYTVNASITLYAVWELSYVKPRINNLTVTRCNSAGTASDTGTYALVKFDWACDKTLSSIVIKWKSTSTSEQSVTVSASGTSGSVSKVIGSGGLSTENTYTVSIVVTDASGYMYAFATLYGLKIAIDFIPGVKGASFGKPAELEGVLDIAFKTKLSGGLYPILLPAETDLDNVLIPNVYAGENVSTYNYGNCPLDSGTFSLEVTAQGPGNQIRQIISQCHKTNPLTYERTYYTSAWGEWLLRSATYDSGWVNLTLGSEFRQYGTGNAVRYRKIGSMVEVRGIVAPVADIAGGTDMHTIATLPSGARPSESLYTICQGSSNCTWLFRVNSNGTLDFSRYRNGGTTATAGAGTWLPFQMTFLIG